MRQVFQRPFAIFFASYALGAGYGAALSGGTITSDAFAAAAFCILMALLAFWLIFAQHGTPLKRETLAAIGVAAPLGILSATAVLGTAETYFWVYDSNTAHVPMAKDLMAIVSGKVPTEHWSVSKFVRTGGITHLFVGTWFALFGASAVVSSLAMTALKFGTIWILSAIGLDLTDDVFNHRSSEKVGTNGNLAFVPYAVVPTVTFHTLAFYKEAMVHLLVAVALYAIFKARKSLNLRWAILFGMALCGLAVERFYVAALLSPLFLLPLIQTERPKRVRYLIALGCLLIMAVVLAPFQDVSWSKALETIQELRLRHSRYPGVSVAYNYEISYPIAVLKTLFTPIWAPNKLEMFRGASALFTWGSFIHQAVMLLYIAGVYRAVKTRGWQHLYMQLPFLLFVLAAAYIAPWSARTRDSFYPLISIYAFLAIDWLIANCSIGMRSRSSEQKDAAPHKG